MFKHILVPVDGSPSSLTAVAKGVEVAKAFDAAMTVVAMVDPYPFIGVGPEFAYGQDQYLVSAKAQANDAIAAARAVIESAGVKVDARVLESHVTWRGIVEAADAIKADLIVMGSHGRRGFEKLVLGSVTERVLRHTTLPVMVVRG